MSSRPRASCRPLLARLLAPLLAPRCVQLALLLALVGAAAPALALKAVFVVRHAEKANQTDKDPELSLYGEDRAIALTRLVRGTTIDAVFVTELRRTRDTAAPLCRQRALKPTVVKAGDTPGLLAQLRALPKDAVAVVVGHSNTVPEILAGLGVKQKIEIRDDEYGRVFVVVPGPDGAATMLELEY
ncbi:MAG: histidine phosphatase family protein [Deltaproteobacteria bacterium]|nr:histidine phosphatase family protein [Deltaproteobacteria bacterium]